MTSAAPDSIGAVVRELLASRYGISVEISDDQDLYELLELDVSDRLQTFRGLLSERFPSVPIPEVLTIRAIQRAASLGGDGAVNKLSAKASAALPKAVAQAIVRTRAELSSHFGEEDYDAFADPESFAFDPATFAHAVRDAIASVAEHLADPAELTRRARNDRVQFALAKQRHLPLNALVAEIVTLFRLSLSDGKVTIPGSRFDAFHDDLAATVERYVADGDADAETLGTVCATAIKALVVTLSRDSPELRGLHDQTRSALAEELIPKLRRTERRAADIIAMVDAHCSFVRAADVAVAGEVVKYSPKKRFVSGQRITHPKFGAGDVVSVTSTSVKVRFGEVEKMLVHGR